MLSINPLSDFFNAIEKDARISITHIGIYAALLQYWQVNECVNPIRVYSYEVMKIAKISAHATYHKSVKDLNAFGYIRYEPSFKRNSPSKVYLLF
ncbi:hypothetical protein [Mucilaginibacter lappiensis]|uniref:Transcriptional regulator n=1 Tax=Mucilaginibacter lappiensis TaxID=354630 RepID=A0A841JG55_9SPHI|nr:hypothetical protein [Mucilaginibacter lappiensis]MBB6127445.1 hypothetical protein [Mucilaginibacter lappiensis]